MWKLLFLGFFLIFVAFLLGFRFDLFVDQRGQLQEFYEPGNWDAFGAYVS